MGLFGGDRDAEGRDDAGARRYTVGGRPLRCAHCTGEQFTGREIPLGSRTAAVLNTEWLAPGAYAMTCASCSAMQWFAAQPERLDP